MQKNILNTHVGGKIFTKTTLNVSVSYHNARKVLKQSPREARALAALPYEYSPTSRALSLHIICSLTIPRFNTWASNRRAATRATFPWTKSSQIVQVIYYLMECARDTFLGQSQRSVVQCLHINNFM